MARRDADGNITATLRLGPLSHNPVVQWTLWDNNPGPYWANERGEAWLACFPADMTRAEIDAAISRMRIRITKEETQ